MMDAKEVIDSIEFLTPFVAVFIICILVYSTLNQPPK